MTETKEMVIITVWVDGTRLGYFEVEQDYFKELESKELLSACVEFHVMKDWNYFGGYTYRIED